MVKLFPQSETGKRFSLKDRGRWLPAVALFLCLALFAMAAIVLVASNAEPVTGQSAYVTGVSAQGYQGLKRLLLARGHTVVVNRDEDWTGRPVADIDVITLDGDNVNLLFGADPSQTADNQASSQQDASSSASSGVSISVNTAPKAPRQFVMPVAPNPSRVQQILYHPLGRVVLVVAPKWSAQRMVQHPLWDVDPSLISAPVININLSVLNPAEARPHDPGDPAKPVKLTPPPGRRLLQNGRQLITFDAYAYDLKRDTRPKTAAEKKVDDAARKMMGGMAGADGEDNDNDVPLRRHWSLSGKGFPNLDTGVIAGMQSITATNLQPVLTTQDGRAILSRVIVTGNRPQPASPVYLLSEPDLLNNQILSDPQRTLTALNLIDSLAPAGSAHPASIVFDLTFAGMGFDHDLLHTLTRPPFIAAPICLLLTGLALMWAAFSRFGPPRIEAEGPPLGRGVRVLADNAARLLALTLKEARLAPAYAQHVRDLVLKERGYMQVSQNEPPDDLAERIGRAHHTQDSYLDLKNRADRAVTVHQLIDITRRLHAWKTEIERAHI